MEVVISSPLWLSLVFPGSEHLHDGTQQSRSQGDKSRDGLISISHVKMIGKSTGVILLHGIRHQVKQRGFYGCSRDQCLEEIDRTDEVSIYEIKPVTIHLIPWVHMMRRIFAYQGKHHIRGHFSQFHRGRKLLCLHHVRRVLLDVDFIYFICKVGGGGMPTRGGAGDWIRSSSSRGGGGERAFGYQLGDRRVGDSVT
ncbi:uncharacterized protein [Triticum aestivum]|uniref:uncharacterized protein isoform X2 n=2 Tax=Triticum aestivum TaxID=4565 RepID=UPI001D019E57|nr:uncharacterized protein LOC123112540 isoform X2 [Triticum aestivum]